MLFITIHLAQNSLYFEIADVLAVVSQREEIM